MEKCKEVAKILVPWGGKILKYCPVHANNIVLLSNAIGSPVVVDLINSENIECQSLEELTEEEKVINKDFNINPQ